MGKINYPELNNVCLMGGDLGEFSEKIRKISLPDILKKFTADGILSNYDRMAEGLTGGHAGPPWYHGLICETIRGASDFLVIEYDADIDRELDNIIAHMTRALDVSEDGYFNPYIVLMAPHQRWGRNGGSIRFLHETYNVGALIEAGIHHFKATGKTSLLRLSVISANYLCGFIGDAPKHNIVCEHSLCEESLLNLYRLFTQNPELAEELNAVPQEYKRLSRFFIDHKGDNETRYTFPKFLQEYAQDHRPATEQREAVGHAVRATLFYSVMADTVYEDNDEDLRTAVTAIWKDIVETKFHANGSVGAYPNDEKFGQQYELPNNAYLETCAGVGMIFFGANMAKISGDASVFDIIESTIYNLLRASVSDTFNHYTYENPLETNGDFARWEWHGCPCCPPMLLKAVGKLPTLIYSFDDEKVMVNLYTDSKIDTDGISLVQKNGTFVFEADCSKALALRIPEWTRDFKVLYNGKPIVYDVVKGYAVLQQTFRKNDCVEVKYDVPIVKYIAHPYVTDDQNKVMVKHGPVLYCAESVDIGKYEEPSDFEFELAVDSPLKLCSDHTIEAQKADGTPFKLIPYYKWNNRGSLPMRVWLKQEGYFADPNQLDGWEHKLYRPYQEYNT